MTSKDTKRQSLKQLLKLNLFCQYICHDSYFYTYILCFYEFYRFCSQSIFGVFLTQKYLWYCGCVHDYILQGAEQRPF